SCAMTRRDVAYQSPIDATVMPASTMAAARDMRNPVRCAPPTGAAAEAPGIVPSWTVLHERVLTAYPAERACMRSGSHPARPVTLRSPVGPRRARGTGVRAAVDAHRRDLGRRGPPRRQLDEQLRRGGGHRRHRLLEDLLGPDRRLGRPAHLADVLAGGGL